MKRRAIGSFLVWAIGWSALFAFLTALRQGIGPGYPFILIAFVVLAVITFAVTITESCSTNGKAGAS